MQKRLIEWNLPLADISEESAREKNIRQGHPSSLHTWWSRKPLASSRASAFTALMDDPGEDFPEKRKYFETLVSKIIPWEAVNRGESQDIQDARKLIIDQFGRAPKVLDPFSGGGSIPLEAQRFGCETYAVDYNPIAVLIEKATLEWPQKYSIEKTLPSEIIQKGSPSQTAFGEDYKSVRINLLGHLLEKWTGIIFKEIYEEVNKYYPTDPGGWVPVAYFWARTIPCQNPACQTEIPLLQQYWLAKKNNKKIAFHPIVDQSEREINFEIFEGEKEINACGFDPSEGTVTRGDVKCPICEQVIKVDQTRQLAQNGKMHKRLIGLALTHPNKKGKRYRIATEDDIDTYEKAQKFPF